MKSMRRPTVSLAALVLVAVQGADEHMDAGNRDWWLRTHTLQGCRNKCLNSNEWVPAACTRGDGSDATSTFGSPHMCEGAGYTWRSKARKDYIDTMDTRDKCGTCSDNASMGWKECAKKEAARVKAGGAGDEIAWTPWMWEGNMHTVGDANKPLAGWTAETCANAILKDNSCDDGWLEMDDDGQTPVCRCIEPRTVQCVAAHGQSARTNEECNARLWTYKKGNACRDDKRCHLDFGNSGCSLKEVPANSHIWEGGYTQKWEQTPYPGCVNSRTLDQYPSCTSRDPKNSKWGAACRRKSRQRACKSLKVDGEKVCVFTPAKTTWTEKECVAAIVSNPKCNNFWMIVSKGGTNSSKCECVPADDTCWYDMGAAKSRCVASADNVGKVCKTTTGQGNTYTLKYKDGNRWKEMSKEAKWVQLKEGNDAFRNGAEVRFNHNGEWKDGKVDSVFNPYPKGWETYCRRNEAAECGSRRGRKACGAKSQVEASWTAYDPERADRCVKRANFGTAECDKRIRKEGSGREECEHPDGNMFDNQCKWVPGNGNTDVTAASHRAIGECTFEAAGEVWRRGKQQCGEFRDRVSCRANDNPGSFQCKSDVCEHEECCELQACNASMYSNNNGNGYNDGRRGYCCGNEDADDDYKCPADQQYAPRAWITKLKQSRNPPKFDPTRFVKQEVDHSGECCENTTTTDGVSQDSMDELSCGFRLEWESKAGFSNAKQYRRRYRNLKKTMAAKRKEWNTNNSFSNKQAYRAADKAVKDLKWYYDNCYDHKATRSKNKKGKTRTNKNYKSG